MADTDAVRRSQSSMSWRVFLANAAVLATAAVVLLLSPVTVSHPVSAHEAAVVVAGLCVMLILNLWLVRRALGPLRRLAEDMDRTDLLDTAAPRLEPPSGDAEIVRLASSYRAMLDRLRAERRDSARRAATAQEEERRHVARELHDQVGQVLTGLVLQIDRLATDADPAMQERIIPVREAARGALEDVRGIARALRPDVLEDLGLVPALQGLATRFARDTGIHVDRRLQAPSLHLDHDAELAIYRIAQEALTNVARHAGATSVELALESDADGLRLTVRDDGRGLNGTRADRAGGLRWMRERAVLVDGVLDVRSEDATGTTVSLVLPVQEVAWPASR